MKQEFLRLDILEQNADIYTPSVYSKETVFQIEDYLKSYDKMDLSLLDVCTGNGCIAIALDKTGYFSKIVGVDISEKAICAAQTNAKDNKSEIYFKVDNMEKLSTDVRFDIISCFPPYLDNKEWSESLQPKSAYVPTDSLISMAQYIEIIARNFLKPNGAMFIACPTQKLSHILRDQFIVLSKDFQVSLIPNRFDSENASTLIIRRKQDE